jgi:hypothetical protein
LKKAGHSRVSRVRIADGRTQTRAGKDQNATVLIGWMQLDCDSVPQFNFAKFRRQCFRIRIYPTCSPIGDFQACVRGYQRCKIGTQCNLAWLQNPAGAGGFYGAALQIGHICRQDAKQDTTARMGIGNDTRADGVHQPIPPGTCQAIQHRGVSRLERRLSSQLSGGKITQAIQNHDDTFVVRSAQSAVS